MDFLFSVFKRTCSPTDKHQLKIFNVMPPFASALPLILPSKRSNKRGTQVMIEG